MPGGLAQSSSSSGIFFQGDVQSQTVVNSHLNSSFSNSPNSISGTGYSNLETGDMNNTVFDSVANSGPSVGASSLVTDANSALSGGPHLQRSASINTESYMRLPASPMSFSSNNIAISGSPIMDGSSVLQQNSQQDQNSQQVQQSGQQLQRGASSATSLPTSHTSHVSLPVGGRLPGSFVPDPPDYAHMQKKPRLDTKPEAVLQRLLQRQDSMQLQGHNPQLQAFIQQQRLRQHQQQQQQQQLLLSMPPLQRAHLLQQMQWRQHLQQQAMQPASVTRHPNDNAQCASTLMQYLYHQRQRPSDNNIAYWRKFVATYYSPRAKQRWCLSLHSNVSHHASGVFPHSAMDAWHCYICGSKAGKGFEATFETLPRLLQIKYSSGVLDELLYLDLPRESATASGVVVMEYGKAVLESVYELLRVVHEGQLRIIFGQDQKILLWEFCARRHDELLPRRLVAPQVNQLLQVAQKCQKTIAESGSEGVSQQDLRTNSNMVLAAGRQLAKILEPPSLNDLGFPKRYVRSLQISEVFSSMKDLMDISLNHKVGPIEALKNYPRHLSSTKLQMAKMQEMGQPQTIPGHPTAHQGLGNQVNNISMAGRGALSGSAQAALPLSTYQDMLRRQNSPNMAHNPLQQEPSYSFTNYNTRSPSSFQGAAASAPGSMLNSFASGLPSPRLPPPQQPYPQMHVAPNSIASAPRSSMSFGHLPLAAPVAGVAAAANQPASNRRAPSWSNGLNATAANVESSSAATGNPTSNQKEPNLVQEEVIAQHATTHDFPGSEFLSSDFDDLDFDWKA